MIETIAHPIPNWPLELSIGGEPVLGRAETVPVYDPATEDELVRLPQADDEQVGRAIAAARQAFDEGP